MLVVASFNMNVCCRFVRAQVQEDGYELVMI